MNSLARVRSGLPQEFHPETTKADLAKIQAIKDVAAKIKDWPLLEEAVDVEIALQAEFVRWWDHNVHRKGGERWIDPADLQDQKLSMTNAETGTGIANYQTSRWRKSIEDAVKYRQKLWLAACRKAGLEPEENHRAEGTGDNQWFTPAQYIEAAREVMGGIDLDPASHPIAQQTVRAARYFTPEEDGLQQEWQGRIWLNPPYAQALIGKFIDKLIEEREAGRINQAILLTHNYTDTNWFHRAERIAWYICFTRGRIKFIDEDGDECAPTQGQAFFYYGDRDGAGRFADSFLKFGFIR